MGEIHIFTAQKGGAGRTIFSLCALLSYFKKRKNVLILDLSFTNPDITNIFQRITNWSKHRYSAITFEKSLLYFQIDSTIYVSYPTNPQLLPTGIIDIYNYIALASKQVYEINGFKPDAILVDTSLSLANFGTSKELQNQIQQIITPICEVYSPYYWCIWSLSNFINGINVNDSRCSFSIIAETLEQLKLIWGGNFDETKNLIHVFTIYSLYPYLKERLFWQDTNLEGTTIKELNLFSKKNFSKRGISFVELDQLKNEYVKILDQDMFNLSDRNREMYEALGDTIKVISERQFAAEIPRNLLPIGTYYSQLVGYTDLRAPKVNTMDGLEDSMKPLFVIVNDYLSNLLNNC